MTKCLDLPQVIWGMTRTSNIYQNTDTVGLDIIIAQYQKKKKKNEEKHSIVP